MKKNGFELCTSVLSQTSMSWIVSEQNKIKKALYNSVINVFNWFRNKTPKLNEINER